MLCATTSWPCFVTTRCMRTALGSCASRFSIRSKRYVVSLTAEFPAFLAVCGRGQRGSLCGSVAPARKCYHDPRPGFLGCSGCGAGRNGDFARCWDPASAAVYPGWDWKQRARACLLQGTVQSLGHGLVYGRNEDVSLDSHPAMPRCTSDSQLRMLSPRRESRSGTPTLPTRSAF